MALQNNTLTPEELQTLWDCYTTSPERKHRQALILHYIWLVRYVVSGMNIPQYSILEEQDFVNLGIIGLHEALERYEQNRGLKFETFAFSRIRGAILDELRRLDWLSRTARKKVQDYLSATETVQQKIGREANPEEIRRQLNVSPEEYQTYLAATSASTSGLTMQTDSSYMRLNEDGSDSMNDIADEGWYNPLEGLQSEEDKEFVYIYLEKLPEKKRLVVSLYYFEEMTFKDISAVLNVSESRICQIHTQIIQDIRVKLKKFHND